MTTTQWKEGDLAMAFTAADFERHVGYPITAYRHDCHAASIALVRSEAFTEARVARGGCPGVMGQHSWVVLGNDCYDPNVTVIDPTLWSYDEKVKGLYVGKAKARPHTPHGSGSIWEWGRPYHHGQETVELDTTGLSPRALAFLETVGPLDRKGWAQLAHAPVEGWPSDEIIAAMWQDKRIGALIPIDIVGMATNLNPHGIYMREAA